jgi:hypothetical protein
MTNWQRLKEEGLIKDGVEMSQMSVEDRETLESLSDDEVSMLIEIGKGKLGLDFIERNVFQNAIFF